MLSGPELSIIVPVYNEGNHINNSLSVIAAKAAESTTSFELIVIDDGSRDHTWETLGKFTDPNAQFVTIRLSRNFGKEYATCAGLDHARGKAVIVMDGDLQHPHELIAEMMRLWREEGAEVVEAVKIDRANDSFSKRLSASLFYNTLNHMSGYNLRNASDFKLMDAKVVRAWQDMPEKMTFFRGMSAWLGYTRRTVTFTVAPRAGETTRWSVIGLIRLAVNAIVSFSTIPLRFVSLAGVAFLCGAIILGIHTLVQKLQGAAVTGFTTVILLLLFFGSIVMLSLGIIGEYIAAIYHEVKQRPRYLISDKRMTLPMVRNGIGEGEHYAGAKATAATSDF